MSPDFSLHAKFRQTITHIAMKIKRFSLSVGENLLIFLPYA